MTHLPLYTALIGAALLVLQLALMMMTGMARFRTQQGLGDGGDESLLQAIRRHGNLAENAPIFIALLAVLEIISGSTGIVLGIGVAFVLVRIAHAVGISIGSGPNAPRAIGAFGTLLSGLTLAGFLVVETLRVLA